MAVAAVCIGGACSRDDSTRKAVASVLPLCSSIIDAAVVSSDDTGYNKHSEEEDGRPATARPLAGAVGCGQVGPLQRGDLLRLMPPARGRSAVAKAPCKGATSCGQGPMHRGRPAPASLQGRPAVGRRPRRSRRDSARPRRGHRGDAHPRPARRGAASVATAKFEVTLPELLNMLREAESAIKKEKPVLYTGETKKKRKASKTLKNGKGKERQGKIKRRKPLQGAVAHGHGQPPWRWRPAVAKAPLQRGDRLRPSPLQRVAARGHDRLRPARKGRLPTEHLQGGGRQRPARKGQPEAASPATSRDDDPYQGDCQPQRATVACAGAAATAT
ncbi:hypothetical protein BHM03_00009002 [Ensete ventricosum]|nr:hypothetical protein BHM03_00009002 [Ensete ventricosum]